MHADRVRRRETSHKTLAERGLDFAHAAQVLEGTVLEYEDKRHDYGETRFISTGLLDARLVVLVWTPRGEARRIISMRYANEREQARFHEHLG